MKKVFSFNIFQNTLLHVACESGNVELVKFLVSSNKVDINSVNKTIFFYIMYMAFFFFALFIGQFYILHANSESENCLIILKLLK